MDYIKELIEDPSLLSGDATRSSSSDEEDFFPSLKSSHAQESSKQLDAHLACSADQMDPLKSLPAVCDVEYTSTCLYSLSMSIALALQDLSSAHREHVWILAILKTNSC